VFEAYNTWRQSHPDAGEGEKKTLFEKQAEASRSGCRSEISWANLTLPNMLLSKKRATKVCWYHRHPHWFRNGVKPEPAFYSIAGVFQLVLLV
jgi:hypothetical protein